MTASVDAGVLQPKTVSERNRVPADARHLEGVLILRDGAEVRVRPIRPADKGRLQAFHAGLSAEAITFRFFHLVPVLSDDMAEHLTTLDYESRMAVVATVGAGEDEHIVAVVRYDRIGPESAEVAFVVEDDYQHRGIATALLHQLAAYARARGFKEFVAITMGDNIPMLDVFRHCGFPTRYSHEAGDVSVHLDISRPPTFAWADK